MQAFAGGELALPVLDVDAPLTAAQLGAPPQLSEVVEKFFVGRESSAPHASTGPQRVQAGR